MRYLTMADTLSSKTNPESPSAEAPSTSAAEVVVGHGRDSVTLGSPAPAAAPPPPPALPSADPAEHV